MSEEKESPLDVEEVAEKEEVLSVIPLEPGPEKKKEDVRKRLLKKAGKKVIPSMILIFPQHLSLNYNLQEIYQVHNL